jgi:hypothetical protein
VTTRRTTVFALLKARDWLFDLGSNAGNLNHGSGHTGMLHKIDA